MNEQEWLTETDPYKLLRQLRGQAPLGRPPHARSRHRLSERKWRLLAVVLARRCWHMLSNDCRRAVCVAEVIADEWSDVRRRAGLADMRGTLWHDWSTDDELATRESYHLVQIASACLGDFGGGFVWPPSRNVGVRGLLQPHQVMAAVRDLAGNPYRPSPYFFDTDAKRGYALLGPVVPYPQQPPGTLAAVVGERCYERSLLPEWNDGVVPLLAEETYRSRRVHGSLDPHLVGTLADSLEEAGAPAELIDHLRTPCPWCKDATFEVGDLGTPLGHRETAEGLQRKCLCEGTRLAEHFRGCWAIDALTGRG